MSWRKHLVAVPQGAKLQAAIHRLHKDLDMQSPGAYGSKFSSYLPEVYAGQPNRVERYQQYDSMDKDPEVNSAIDTIADFATLAEEHKDTPFKIRYHGDPTEAESDILVEALNKWSQLNKFKQRIWRIFRSTIMYGDQFFIRDPETFQWYWANHEKVESITVNESEGKEPQYYNIRDIDLNLQSLVATLPTGSSNRGMSGWAGPGISATARNAGPVAPMSTPITGGNVGQNVSATSVDATHVIHLSLSEGIDANWPFGSSILEAVFKPFKQKELLEDSIIIYRVQRAPERRVFYIDVGNAPTHKAMEFVNRIKNEIHQRRIPSQSGGGTNVMDAAYNPLCLALDTKIPLIDGRTYTLEELIKMHEEGLIIWVYSCDPETGRLAPGKVTWAGVTRENADVVKVTLDNGESFRCTPDHKVVTRSNGFVPASELKEGDALMPLITGINPMNPMLRAVYDVKQNKWKESYHIMSGIDKLATDANILKAKLPYSTENLPTERKVVSVEEESEKINVGTLTIDANEEIHNFHTFALDCGIFVKNSIIEDYFFPQTCLSLDTLIRLTDGRDLSLAAIIEEYNEAKELYVYSVSKAWYQPEPGRIKWAGVTRKKADVVKVILDNEQEVVATPDHRFIAFTGKEIEAKDLKKGDKLLPYQNVLEDRRKFVTVKSVENLREKVDTGDITIESPSNSHWFYLSAGVYVHNSEGRGSKVDTLPGGENLGEIDDLKYFNNKLLRGLRVPPSYLPFGPDDSSATTYSDGRVGTAYMQEFRFAKYVKRLQNLINPVFDREFKLFLRHRGIQIDSSLFEIEFHEPQNFSKFRQLEIDAAQINTFQPLAEVRYFSKRFLMERFLGMNPDEIARNEQLWREENPTKAKPVGTGEVSGGAGAGGLGDVGIRPVPGGDEGGEMPAEGGSDTGAESPISGDEGGAATPAPAASGGDLEI